MRSLFSSRARRWLGASALAIIASFGGVSAFVASSQQAAAQITVPAIAAPSFADLVEAVKPAVVSIQVEGEEASRRPGGRRGGNFNFDFPDLPEDHPFRRFFDQFGDQFGQGEGQQQRPPRRYMATGSGFVVSADGYIVTNNHVVQDANKVTVVFENGDEQEATVVGTDERTDLAVLKVEKTELPFVEFSNGETRVGDWVVAVGNPFGLGGTVTVGIVSARGRDISGSAYGDFLQIDAAVNSGNSGGPAFNLEGQVVGVNTAIFSPNGGNVGIAFAIPAATVKQVVDSLITEGSVTRGFLGVAIQDVNRDLADSVGLDSPRGALVTEPSEGGPAARAGINSGDVIVEVDGDAIDNALDLSRTIAGKSPGTSVNLTVWRNGQEEQISVTLDTLTEEEQAEAPAQPAPVEPAAPAPSSVGLTLVPNEAGDGLAIQEIDPQSTAAEKGFAIGDVILQVDNKDVASVADFEAALKGVKDAGRNAALIKAERGGNVRFIGLPLGS